MDELEVRDGREDGVPAVRGLSRRGALQRAVVEQWLAAGYLLCAAGLTGGLVVAADPDGWGLVGLVAMVLLGPLVLSAACMRARRCGATWAVNWLGIWLNGSAAFMLLFAALVNIGGGWPVVPLAVLGLLLAGACGATVRMGGALDQASRRLPRLPAAPYSRSSGGDGW